MGICCSRTNKNTFPQQKYEIHQTTEAPAQAPAQAPAPATEQVGNNGQQQEIDLLKEPVKPQVTQTDTQNQDVQNFNEEIFVSDIMKSFDELNQLFNQMAQEFDSISQYLQSMSGYQE